VTGPLLRLNRWHAGVGGVGHPAGSKVVEPVSAVPARLFPRGAGPPISRAHNEVGHISPDRGLAHRFTCPVLTARSGPCTQLEACKSLTMYSTVPPRKLLAHPPLQGHPSQSLGEDLPQRLSGNSCETLKPAGPRIREPGGPQPLKWHSCMAHPPGRPRRSAIALSDRATARQAIGASVFETHRRFPSESQSVLPQRAVLPGFPQFPSALTVRAQTEVQISCTSWRPRRRGC